MLFNWVRHQNPASFAFRAIRAFERVMGSDDCSLLFCGKKDPPLANPFQNFLI
jgi:hypothetical protein